MFIATTGMCRRQHIEHSHLSVVLVQGRRLAKQLAELATVAARLLWHLEAVKPTDLVRTYTAEDVGANETVAIADLSSGVRISLSILLMIVSVPWQLSNIGNSIGIMQPIALFDARDVKSFPLLSAVEYAAIKLA